MKEEFILKLVQIQLQVKFLHWQTLGDAKHRAYGDLYEKWVETIDEFAEQMMGKYGRIELDPEFSDYSATHHQPIQELFKTQHQEGLVRRSRH
mgnify:CR=1 FL=1